MGFPDTYYSNGGACGEARGVGPMDFCEQPLFTGSCHAVRSQGHHGLQSAHLSHPYGD